MNIIFFGSSSYVIPIIKVLKENFNLSLVLTTEKPKNDLTLQGLALQSYSVIGYCVENKIPYFSVSSPSDLIHHSSFIIHHSTLAVLADFGLIIPKEILNAFTKGVINIHPSLLPKYRGPTPVQTAILNGDKFTGVSIMKLDNQIDHGPILKQEREEILPLDTAESLYQRLFAKGANLLPKVLDSYFKDNLKPVAQDHTKATFTKPLTRQDGFVDISKITCPSKLEERSGENYKSKIARMVRAYYPWPGVWTRFRLNYGGQAKLKIIKFLPEQKIQVEGKKPMSYKDFLNGYPQTKEILRKINCGLFLLTERSN